MQQPVLVTRYDRKVWETPAMDAQRKEHCMCHHCGNMRPNTPYHCPIAQAFYELCKVNGVAFIMTRCGSWVPGAAKKLDGDKA